MKSRISSIIISLKTIFLREVKKEIEQLIKDNKADSIVLYRLPNDTKQQLLIGEAEVIENGLTKTHLSKEGFAFEPFSNNKMDGVFVNSLFYQTFLSPLESDVRQLISSFIHVSDPPSNVSDDDYADYSRHFDTMHQEIIADNIDKCILSRTKHDITIEENQVLFLFEQLSAKYPHAFVYVISSRKTGVWLGAGPELLLKKRGLQMSTVALAGTLPNKFESQWSAKELNEQGLVSEYVEEVLLRNNARKIDIQGPETINAGQVNHLCTQFTFECDSDREHDIDLLYDLHPTPAVCGMPKEKALSVILNTEKHNREYYSGFLGPVNAKGFEFFVNIRCLKAQKNESILFIGGGLTKDSKVEKEWAETELKAQTLLSVLKNI